MFFTKKGLIVLIVFWLDPGLFCTFLIKYISIYIFLLYYSNIVTKELIISNEIEKKIYINEYIK